MNKVMVTGGCGFIGSHIVEKLIQSKYEVIVVDNLISGKLENIDVNKVTFYNCDILSWDFEEIVTITKPDYIIHQAAQVNVSKSIDDVKYDTKVNVQGSVNVIEAARKNKIKKIIFASTAAVYGEPQYLPIDTSHLINPLSPYGLSKHTVERYLEMAKNYYGVDYTILRYSNVYGPRQDTEGEGGVVAIFAEKLANNLKVSIHGDGEQTRDFVFVEDVANANILSLNKGGGKTLNVSSSQRISINKLFTMLKAHIDVESMQNYAPQRDGDIRDSSLSNKLTFEVLEWLPTYSLEHGLKKTVEFYRRTSLH